MGFFYYLCKLGYLMGLCTSWYIIATYCYVILPTSKPTKNEDINLLLIIINYGIHFILIGFQQYSYFMVQYKDPGYFKSFYEAIKI